MSDAEASALPSRWASRLTSAGLHDARVLEVRAGIQADVYKLQFGPSAPQITLALKLFHVDKPSNTPASVAHEAKMLQRFADGLKEACEVSVRCPTVIEVFPDELGYLATWERGIALDELLPSLNWNMTADLARAIVHASDIYHAACDEPYGDFHPANVLVDQSTLVLVDPTIPSIAHLRAAKGVSHLEADIAYWTHSVSSRALGQYLHGQAGKSRALATITGQVLREALARSADRSLAAHAIREVAYRHHDRISRSPKGLLIRAFARSVTRRIVDQSLAH